VLLWGTGFATTEFLRGIRVTGRDGADLHQRWGASASAYLGLAVPGFPNLFCVYGPYTNLGGSSIIAMMEAQAEWIGGVASRMLERGTRPVEVREDAARRFDAEMQDRLGDTPWVRCDNWYNVDGKVTTNWPGLVAEYQSRLIAPDWDDLRVG
jgi:cation diffusion facilitator CzcD-associated flavoprotein CzcO